MEDISLHHLKAIVYRRRWIAVALFTSVMAAVVGAVGVLPNIYTARAFILVDDQQIPQDLVRSTVSINIQTRLHTISQEIMSRSRLEKLIKDFRLYERLQKTEPMDEVIGAMRRDIGIEIKQVDSRTNRVTAAFEVSYSGTDPRKVTLVTNALASFYIEEDLKARERQASGTKDFLQVQVEEVKKRLVAREKAMADYKQRYLDELPEEKETNLRGLEQLQAQGRTVADNLARAQGRRNLVYRQIAGQEPAKLAVGTARLDALLAEAATLQIAPSDRPADVARMAQVTADIAALEAELARNIATGPLLKHLDEVSLETRVLSVDLAKIRQQMAVHRQRIASVPRREQELIALGREYKEAADLHASLVKRQEEASLAESMEHRQKGQQFRILDPATFPELPTGPPRVLLLVVGFAAAVGAAIAGVVLREHLDSSFRLVEDLRGASNIPVLVTIPLITTARDQRLARRRRGLGVVGIAMTMLVLGGTTSFFMAGNEKLVRLLLLKPSGTSQLR